MMLALSEKPAGKAQGRVILCSSPTTQSAFFRTRPGGLGLFLRAAALLAADLGPLNCAACALPRLKIAASSIHADLRNTA
jgi:hypothetical protein